MGMSRLDLIPIAWIDSLSTVASTGKSLTRFMANTLPNRTRHWDFHGNARA